MPMTIKIDHEHSPQTSSRSTSQSESTTDEELSSGSWDHLYSEDIDPSDSASHSPHPSGRRARAPAPRPTRRHSTSERSSRRPPTARVSRQAPLPPPSSVDPDDYPGYGRGYPAPPSAPYGGRMAPGYAASAFSVPGGGGYGPPPFGGALTQYGPPGGYQYPPGNPFSPQTSPPVPPGGAGYFSGAHHPMSTFNPPQGPPGHDLMSYQQQHMPGYGGYQGYHPPPGMPPHMGGYMPPHWPPTGGGDPSVVGDPEMEKKMLAIEEKMKNQSIDFERAKKEIEARDAAAMAAKQAAEARSESDRKAKEETEAWEKKLDEEKKAAQKQGADNARIQIEADRKKAEEKAAELKTMADAKAAVEKAEADAKVAVAKAETERKEAIDKAEKEAKEAVAKAEKEAKEAVDKALAPKDDKKKPIKFKDAVGRKFSFPFHLCATWVGMEELIKQAFLHVEAIGPQVQEGHYDLVGPNGEIILPQVWETMIEPDWSITMHMWPMPEPRGLPLGPGGIPLDRPRSRHEHSRHRVSIPGIGHRPGPPVTHRGAPPPPPHSANWPRAGMMMPGHPGPGPGPGPGTGASPLILAVAPKSSSRKKSDPAKGMLGWMAGKPSKPSGKGPKKAEQNPTCILM